MVTDFRKSLPAGFHTKNSSPVKTMEKLKHGIKISDQVVFDLESIFLRLLLVGQQREMELLPIFGYELCAVPPSVLAESPKTRLALCPATEKSSFLTSMQMNRPRTTRGAGELVLAPPHSTWL